MTKYKTVATANGRMMYFMNGKMVSKTAIPASILNNLDPGTEIEIGTTDPEVQTVDQTPVVESESVQSKVCIFCQQDATHMRFLNGVTIPLCKEDKESHTSGEIVEQYNKI